MADSTKPDDLVVWDFQFDFRVPFIDQMMSPRGCNLRLDELRSGFVSRLKVEDYGQRLRIHNWIGVGGQHERYGWRDYSRPDGARPAELWFLRGSVPPSAKFLISPYRWSLRLRTWKGALPASPLVVELSFLHCRTDDFGEESTLESDLVFTVPLDESLLDDFQATGQEREAKMVDRSRVLGEGHTWFGSAGSPPDWSWSLQRQW